MYTKTHITIDTKVRTELYMVFLVWVLYTKSVFFLEGYCIEMWLDYQKSLTWFYHPKKKKKSLTWLAFKLQFLSCQKHHWYISLCWLLFKGGFIIHTLDFGHTILNHNFLLQKDPHNMTKKNDNYKRVHYAITRIFFFFPRTISWRK